MNMLTIKRKSSSITTTNGESNTKQKKLKTNHSKQPITDCRQMPFTGINIKT